MENSINLNFSSSVNLFCSSCQDILLYNKHKTFCKYLLHRWATWKSCFESVFYGQKAEKYCNDTTAESNWFDFAAVFLQHFFAVKIKFTPVFNGWATGNILYPCAARHFFVACRWKMLLVAPELYMLKKWIIDARQMIFLCSANDFYCQEMTFTCLAIDFYIQQMTFTFNKTFIYSAIWNLCSVIWGFYWTIWDLRLTKWNLLN